MSDYRIFVEKKGPFRVEAESLRKELNSNLGLDIKDLRLLCVYDIFNSDDHTLDLCRYSVFGEKVTDDVFTDINLDSTPYLAMEFLPGQFDQRAASAEECVRLHVPDSKAEIRSGKLLVFDSGVDAEALAKIKHYCINSVESREKDLSILRAPERAKAKEVATLDGLRSLTPEEAASYCKEKGLAMNAADLMEVVDYFNKEGRDPNETELRILDTYWSDHCRHTTFTTRLENIDVEKSAIEAEIRESLKLWNDLRKETGREAKPLCLMDLATIAARVLSRRGMLPALEQSEENNACSVFVDAESEEGSTERWLLQFKNETHNHPTEIEPFGGASTCLGGAIRDPLSGRSYVYQAMRVTGAADIYKSVADTLPGKLPQRVISTRAAAGYSSYGNQIGLATTHVREVYHPGYVAKRLEVGAVVGAVKASDVRRESPAEGDVILMLGGRTGRDGIGGATGSSKEHTLSSLEECGSEVQKGNAPEERKIQRLFRRPEVCRLIKKSNDFGAGGVSVAIGELADSLDIYLDRVPVKYSGLNPTEIAISESQERMAVVIEAKDREEFEKYCREENLEVTHVADVTATGRMRMFYKGELAADLRREFIDSAGAPHFASAVICAPETEGLFANTPEGAGLKEKMLNRMSDYNVTSQKGLIEMFDSSIGCSTVLMPFGGKTQQSETQVSVQTLPMMRPTVTASMMSWGFNPFISEKSPYHGAAYAVTEAIAKSVAAGADYKKMHFSFQEYFERMGSEKSWGKPLSALLGALRMQMEFGLAAIGGKDSMSGTFADISVPPTLIAFAVAPVDRRHVVSTDLKGAGHKLYLLRHTPTASGMPDTEALKKSYDAYHNAIEKGLVVSAYAPAFGGVAEALAKMSFGNGVGVDVNVDEKTLFDFSYGSILFESEATAEELGIPGVEAIGETTAASTIRINGEEIAIDTLLEANAEKFAEIYPYKSGVEGTAPNADSGKHAASPVYEGESVEHPGVFLPLFPGTNCDYDMQKAFSREGAEVSTFVFRNLTPEDVENSTKRMAEEIDKCHILAFSGGFSAGDEPDGSGKFIASVIMNAEVADAIRRLIARGGLILGICNGFQALVKSGLLPYGRIGEVETASPTLFRNDINRHISQIVTTRVGTTASPWLRGFSTGDLHHIAASHGEGRFSCSAEEASRLLRAGQVAFQYADAEGNATMESPANPNGSVDAIEGIISPDGRILGKMGHSERYSDGLMKNIPGEKRQNIFRNAVEYFRNGRN